MSRRIKELMPENLTGPRSYFTDIDPVVPGSDSIEAIRKLKLQLLTKETIIIAASSLFHDIWYKLLKDDKGLVDCLRNGILIPAIRDSFGGVSGFFAEKNYPTDNENFFINNLLCYVTWSLKANTNWFKAKYMEGFDNPNSVLRKAASLSDDQASIIRNKLSLLIEAEDVGSRFLQRPHIEQVSKLVQEGAGNILIEYANLVYSISGSIVVNAEGHFPQSDLSNVSIVGNERLLKDENIFWDIYVEAVFTLLGSAIRITPDRLDNFKFEDILKIRKEFFNIGFPGDYDALLKSVKENVDIEDPDKLILHAHEIAELAAKLLAAFSERVKSELSIKDYKVREGALWQMASGISIVSNPAVAGAAIGVVSTFKALPEITLPFSKRVSTSLEERYQWMYNFINTKLGWSKEQKKSFLDAYKALVQYGLKL